MSADRYATLVDVDTVAAHLGDPAWLVVDCRFALADPEAGRTAWRRATIPQAIYAHLDEDLSGPVIPGRTGRHPLPDPEVFAGALGRWGVAADTQLVAFDDMGGAFAARLWWMARWLGHDAVAVLDGGWSAWTSAGHATAPGRDVARTPTTVRTTVDAARTADAATVLEHVDDHTVVLLDARAPDRFAGQNETTDPVAGHIRGAASAFFGGNLAGDKRFLPRPQLRARYEALLGGRAAQDAICYCGSGVTACHDILAMVHAGLAEPRLYPGSWSEWITDPTRPREP